MTRIFTGFDLADRIQRQTSVKVQRLGRAPVCATLLDDRDPAAVAYLRRQTTMAARVGVVIRACSWDRDPARQITDLVADPAVDAVAALLPLPSGIAAERVAALIGPDKDVEGQHPLNAGRLLLGHGGRRVPPTAEAAWLCAQEILGDLTGAEITLVGASRLIGRPLAMLLADAGATVSLCQAQTRNLAIHTRRADLIVTAAGVPGLIGRTHVAPGGRVLDLGVIATENGLVGDADPHAMRDHAALVSAVPDGVGPVTSACLIANIASAAQGQIENVWPAPVASDDWVTT